MGEFTDILDKNLKGNRSDLYDVVAQDWNEAVAKAFKNKDLSTIPSDFVSYASERLNIPKKTVSTQIDGLKRYGNFKTDFTKIRPFRQQLAKELLTEANQGLKYVKYDEIAKRLGPKYTQATLKTLIKRIDSLPDLDSYQTKVNKAFKNIFVDADPTLLRAEDFFDPANKILDAVGTGTVVKEDRTRLRTDTIYKALKNNPEYKALGYDKVFNRLRSKDFQKVVKNSVRPWNLEDVFYAADTNLNLRNPKSIDERAINFAIRSKVRGNPNIEIFSREGDRLVKINPKTAEINDYYDIVFRMNGKNYGLVGDIPGVIDLKKEGRRLPEFENFYKVAAAKDELAQRTKFPDGSDIINPRTGNPSTFEELMKDAYYYARGKKRGYAMAFPYDIDHLDIKNDPFGSKNPQNLRIIPKRVNVSVGQMVNPEKVTKTGYYFEKDLPIEQQINNMMSREQKLAQDILKFDDQGQHIGRRLDTAARAAEKQILTRGIPDTPKIPIDATRTEFKQIIAKLSEDPTCAARPRRAEGGGVSGLDRCFEQGMKAIKEGKLNKPHQVQATKQLMNAGKRIGASTFARRLLDLGILSEIGFLAGDVGIRRAMGRPFSEAFKAATFRETQADKERIIRGGGSPEVIKARELQKKLKSINQEIKSAESLGDYYSSTDIDALKQRKQNILKELAPFEKYLSLTSPQTISTNVREQNIIDADLAKSPFSRMKLSAAQGTVPSIADYGEIGAPVPEDTPISTSLKSQNEILKREIENYNKEQAKKLLPSSKEAILENLKFNLGDPTADREAKEFYDAGYEIFPDDFTSYKMQLEAQSPGREEQMYGFNPDKGLEIPTLLPKGTYIPSPRQRREQEELMEEMGRLGAASGGLMNLTRTVAPQSGPNAKGLESLRRYATRKY